MRAVAISSNSHSSCSVIPVEETILGGCRVERADVLTLLLFDEWFTLDLPEWEWQTLFLSSFFRQEVEPIRLDVLSTIILLMNQPMWARLGENGHMVQGCQSASRQQWRIFLGISCYWRFFCHQLGQFTFSFLWVLYSTTPCAPFLPSFYFSKSDQIVTLNHLQSGIIRIWMHCNMDILMRQLSPVQWTCHSKCLLSS